MSKTSDSKTLGKKVKRLNYLLHRYLPRVRTPTYKPRELVVNVFSGIIQKELLKTLNIDTRHTQIRIKHEREKKREPKNSSF